MKDFKFSKEEPIEPVEEIFFEVVGAGAIRITKEPHSICGNACGFSFGVSWGRYKYSGGVLGRSEAKRLAEHILAEIAKCTESEEDEHRRRMELLLS